MADGARRAVTDVLAHGLRGGLTRSAVGVELGALLQAGASADVYDGDDELQLFAGLEHGDLQPTTPELPPPR